MMNTSNRKRNRLLLVISALMVFAAVGIYSRMASLQRQAKQAGLPRIVESRTPDLTPQQKAQSIGRARELRAKWRPWALKHRAKLTRMLNAKPEDKTALAAVWDAVPEIPSEADSTFTLRDLVPPGVQPPSSVGFAWVGFEKSSGGTQNAGEQVEFEFGKHRDIIIATSLTARTATHLWASGRITQNGRLPANLKPQMFAKAKAEGRPFNINDMRTPHRQIEPPYDFLPSTSFTFKKQNDE